MKIILTGATGFIGGYLVSSLSRDHQLFCLARDPSKLPRNSQVFPVPGDLGSSNALSGLPAHADAILHFAQANVPFPDKANELFEVNALSTLHLADYARKAGVTHFIYASSGNVYGPSAAPCSEDSYLCPQGLYAVTKQTSEAILGCYKPHFQTCILRIYSAYGPHQKSRLVPNIIQSVRSGRPVTLTNGGHPHVNPVYIDDMVRVVEQAIALKDHQIVNVAGPEVVSIADIANIAGRELNVEPRFELRSNPDLGDSIADTSRMRSLFNLPGLVHPAEGIRRTIVAMKDP